MVKTDKNSKTIEALKRARSIKELFALINPIKDMVDAIKKTDTKILSSLSTVRTVKYTIALSSGELELSDFSKKQKQGSSVRIPQMRTVLENYETPDLKHLTRDSDDLTRLAQGIVELEVAIQVAQQGTMSDLKSRDMFLRATNNLLTDARKALTDHLNLMAKLAKKVKPKQHTKVAKALIDHLKAVLNKKQFSGIDSKTFVFHPKAKAGSKPDTDTLYYQTYIFVENFMNSDEEIYDHYAFILTGVMNLLTGELHHTLTSIKDHLIPGSFHIGQPVESSADLKRRVTLLLNLDNFMSKQNRSTLPGTQYVRRSAINVASENIEKVRVKDDYIYFKPVSSLTDAELNKTIQDVAAAIRTVFRNKLGRNTSLRYSLMKSRRGGANWFKFYITNDGKPDSFQLTNQKLNRLADVLELTPEQVSHIRQAIL